MTEFRPVKYKMCDIQSKEVRWLWRGMIPRGKLTILCGDPGMGKSFVTLDLCARASRGGPWPLDDGPTGAPTSAVLLSAEDDPADTIRPRLEAMGADLSRIQVIDAMQNRSQQVVDFVIGDHSRDLATMLEAEPEIGLLVVDPVSAYVGGTDSYNNAQVRAMLKPLADLAADYEVAVVLVTHMRKNEAAKALHGAMGSLAFTAAARVVLMAMREPDEDEARLLLTVKSNLSSDRVGYRYKIENGRVEWIEVVQGQADEIIAGSRGRSKREEEAAFGEIARRFIAEGGGTRTPTQMADLARQHGFSFTKLQRPTIKAAMGLASKRLQGQYGFAWVLADTPAKK